MEIEKKLVAKNFSRGANTYNEYAKVQSHIAQQLAEKLTKSTEKLNILEIGCGTGIFSKYILEKYPNSNFLFVDIADKMLDYFRKEHIINENTKLLCCDAETYDFKRKFDKIYSNAVFQWYHNLDNALQNYSKLLNKNGEILFTIYGEKTYQELRTIIVDIFNDNKYIQNFVSAAKLKNIMHRYYQNVEIEEKMVIQSFSSLKEYFLYVKYTGSNSASKDKNILSPAKYKKIEKQYNERYSDEKGLKVSNHILYVKATK